VKIQVRAWAWALRPASSKLKWAILSRSEVNIKYQMSSLVATRRAKSVDLEAYRREVEQVVDQLIELKTGELATLKTYDEKLTTFVKKTLQKKAEGTPLWVSLECRELRRSGVKSISTKLVLDKCRRD